MECLHSEDTDMLTLYRQYHTCWWPGDPKIQEIGSHSVDIVSLQLSVHKARRILIVGIVPTLSVMIFSKRYWFVAFLDMPFLFEFTLVVNDNCANTMGVEALAHCVSRSIQREQLSCFLRGLISTTFTISGLRNDRKNKYIVQFLK